jgi:hypothetical protein
MAKSKVFSMKMKIGLGKLDAPDSGGANRQFPIPNAFKPHLMGDLPSGILD